MNGFKAGDVVQAEFPAMRGDFNIEPHYLVILGVSLKGVLAMFTTSLKEQTGGIYQFRPDESQAAGWRKPCRFDPGRIALYETKNLGYLVPTGQRVNARTLERMIKAAQDIKATFVIFNASYSRKLQAVA